MSRLLFVPLTILSLMLWSGEASAHRYHATISSVSFNDRTGSIEVIHQIFSHDVEYILSKYAGQTVQIGAEDMDDMLRAYVENAFALYDKGGAPIPLEWVGAEIDVSNVWVYMERPDAMGLDGVSVRDELMVDLYEDQVNTVNLEQGGELKTLIFQREDGIQESGF